MTIECGKGHLYDPSIYSTCPYCDSSQQAKHSHETPVGAPGVTMPVYKKTSHTPTFSEVPVGADAKTMPPRGYGAVSERRVSESGDTVGIMSETLGFNPVVGWLVCVEGPQKGQDYPLRGYINTIGRNEKADVYLRGDRTVSSGVHARLGYSQRNNRFSLIPTESKNYIYLNGQEVFAATFLKAYDVIDCGNTKLLFIPLCGEQFQWGQQLNGDPDETV